MRLRIRTLLLTVALLCGMTSTASACLPPILNPFCWLFGCGYGYGGYGYGCDYGYGYGYGYGADPNASYRVIDDWLGYGYLRNQEGTLGHYPGRPFGCYQPWFPGLFNPCPPLAPAFAMPGPMVAPIPMPTMHNPCWDPCQSQCADPCMPTPMVQCQPAPAPITTWRPVTVDRGNWQMVWVPRPITTMVPQTQYIPQAPMMDAGCGGDCYGDSGGVMPEMSSTLGGYPVSAYNNSYAFPQMRPRMIRREIRRSAMHYRHFNGPYGQSAYPYQAPNSTGWTQQMTSPVAYGQPAHPQPAYGQQSFGPQMYGPPAYSQPQQFSLSVPPMTTRWAPQSSPAMPAHMARPVQGFAFPGMNVAGDVMGDHELSSATTASVQVVPNSFSGPVPIMRANLSRPVQTMSANRYPNVVR